MTEKNFQTTIQYGSIVLAISVIFNIYMVMHYREVYRDAARADAQVEQLVTHWQRVQALLQDFGARINTDPQIAQLFKQAQAQAAAASAASRNAGQP